MLPLLTRLANVGKWSRPKELGSKNPFFPNSESA
jgi:hypothetical protein